MALPHWLSSTPQDTSERSPVQWHREQAHYGPVKPIIEGTVKGRRQSSEPIEPPAPVTQTTESRIPGPEAVGKPALHRAQEGLNRY